MSTLFPYWPYAGAFFLTCKAVPMTLLPPESEDWRPFLGLLALGAGRNFNLHPEPLELGPFLQALRPTLEGALHGRAQLRLEEASESLWAFMDPDQLHQVLVNLVGNAGESMERPGEVRLTLVRDPLEPFVELGVRGTGPGIPPGIREQIFDPFFTTKAAGQGTGLGLTSVQGVMLQSGGEVRLESEVGRGTTFTLRIPMAQD